MSTVCNEEHGEKLDFTYRSTHKNHPCTKWASTCFENYQWLYQHAIGLLFEYTHRYGKIHASTKVITKCGAAIETVTLSNHGEITAPAQAMPEEFRDIDPVLAYRRYYTEHKMKTIDCKWTNREKPSWVFQAQTLEGSNAEN